MKRWIKGVMLAVLLTFGGGAGWVAWSGNFHSVYDHQVYRSAQLSDDQLRAKIQRYGIRSVLNLRGRKPGESWYRDETAITRELNVVHADYKLSARKELNAKQMAELVSLMEKLPKPLLVHCEGGADRSGLASALYLYAVQHYPAEKAADQLSVRFGHVPYLFWADVEAMDKSFQKYVHADTRTAMPKGGAVPTLDR